MKYTLFLIVTIYFSIILTTKLPNTDYIICGIDMKYGQPLETALRYPIFEPLTYNLNNTVMIGGVEYEIPDQLMVMDYPSEAKTSTNEVYTSQYIIEKSLGESYSVGFNPWFIPGMFSASDQVSYFQEMTETQASYTASSYLKVTTAKAGLKKNIKLLPEYVKELHNLPASFNNETCKQFASFFNRFGTVWSIDAIFGGSVVMSTSFSMEVLQEETIVQVQEDLNEQFLLMTSSETLTAEEEEELTELNAVYKSSMELVGGNPSAYNASQYQLWAATVPTDPVLVSISMRNHSAFLPRNETDRINALDEATQNYYYSSYIGWTAINTAPLYSIGTFGIINDAVYFPQGNPYEHVHGYKYNMTNNLWYPIQTYPLPNIYNSPCTSALGYIYCFGGINDNGDLYYTRNVYRYDPDIDEWEGTTNIPYNIISGFAATVDNKIYVINPYIMDDDNDENYILEDSFVFDPELETYEKLPKYPFGCVVDPRSIVVDDTIYNFMSLNCEMYDTGDSWWTFTVSTDVSSFNTTSQTWTKLASIPQPLLWAGIIELDGDIYLLGGQLYTGPERYPSYPYSSIVYKYNIASDSWSVYDQDAINITGDGVAFTIGRFIYYFGYFEEKPGIGQVKLTALAQYC